MSLNRVNQWFFLFNPKKILHFLLKLFLSKKKKEENVREKSKSLPDLDQKLSNWFMAKEYQN